ncbi:hypothetical protein K493DRAFT_335293 [Basidiobolus meristosporus CBS 931.73]|uniref:Uncharacterized protein n=1 Tax=Basidiobolus meristosporus CBS 931.73 TaxID=1314790 RepID=A0A1Y1YR98_9FUNG|nr:hypothetical protein K493DRAFT_335293 [Basidiobolus meristosporus CBS 931.73]|eukprot:ORY00558.1 hypothetical protein K493DRAFT_335293 [Basidiobolus meristosporus CBS 931.73]
MRFSIAAITSLFAAASLTQAVEFEACINSNGVNCSVRRCPVNECCNFQPDLKNNMASGRVRALVNCVIFYNSNCQGNYWILDHRDDGKFTNLPSWIKNNNAAVRCEDGM